MPRRDLLSVIPRRSNDNGFTLAELAIVLVIVALLTGGLLMTLSAQQSMQRRAATEKILQNANDALSGFVITNGRLPCPAAPETTGIESPLGGGACTHPWTGFVPAITLGLTPTNEQGYAIDDWGNQIRYAVTTSNSETFTTNISSKSIRINWNSGLAPDLRVCSTAANLTGSSATADCASSKVLANTAIAVLFSRGENGAITPTSDDEKANGDGDRLFVSHPPTPRGSNEFDDLVVWLSPNILYNRMIAAGRLP